MFPEFNILIASILRSLSPNAGRTKSLADKLESVIRQRKGETNQTGHLDMVQLMLEASDDGGSDSTNGDKDVRRRHLSEDEMISNSFLFLLAGFETTANCLGFTAYLLAKHPEVQDRLFDEIRDVIGLALIPDYDKAQVLPYLEMVISESLRLLPPVTK